MIAVPASSRMRRVLRIAGEQVLEFRSRLVPEFGSFRLSDKTSHVPIVFRRVSKVKSGPLVGGQLCSREPMQAIGLCQVEQPPLPQPRKKVVEDSSPAEGATRATARAAAHKAHRPQ